MVTYQNAGTPESRKSGGIQCKVLNGKKVVGAIYKTPDGDFYWRPTGGVGVDQFPFGTIAEVKKDLEG